MIDSPTRMQGYIEVALATDKRSPVTEFVLEFCARYAVTGTSGHVVRLVREVAGWDRGEAPREHAPSRLGPTRVPERKFAGESLREEFNRLVTEWKKATGHESSLTKVVFHRAYQRIIGLGPIAVPLILEEFDKRPDHWGWALFSITGEDPGIAPEDAGRLAKIREAWLQWGRREGHLR